MKLVKYGVIQAMLLVLINCKIVLLLEADKLFISLLPFGLLWEFSDLLCCQLKQIPPDTTIHRKQHHKRRVK